jgi:hypothetical protein
LKNKKILKKGQFKKNTKNHKIEFFLFSFKTILSTVDDNDDILFTKKVKTEEEKVNVKHNSYY